MRHALRSFFRLLCPEIPPALRDEFPFQAFGAPDVELATETGPNRVDHGKAKTCSRSEVGRDVRQLVDDRSVRVARVGKESVEARRVALRTTTPHANGAEIEVSQHVL